MDTTSDYPMTRESDSASEAKSRPSKASKDDHVRLLSLSLTIL